MRKIVGIVPKQVLWGLLGGMLMAGYGWVGQSDYENEVTNAEWYCQMVQDGLWPPKQGMSCPAPDLSPSERLVSL